MIIIIINETKRKKSQIFLNTHNSMHDFFRFKMKEKMFLKNIYFVTFMSLKFLGILLSPGQGVISDRSFLFLINDHCPNWTNW